MSSGQGVLPADLADALAALQAERAARQEAEAEAARAQAEAANARAELSDNAALIAHLELRIEKLKRELYGQRSERTARLVEQLELELEDLVAAAQQVGLSLRAGLHTGEVELRGADIGGIAVHAAARVMASCRPGEVLVSRVVTDLVAGAGLQFVERGPHELKGIPGAWTLYSASL